MATQPDTHESELPGCPLPQAIGTPRGLRTCRDAGIVDGLLRPCRDRSHCGAAALPPARSCALQASSDPLPRDQDHLLAFQLFPSAGGSRFRPRASCGRHGRPFTATPGVRSRPAGHSYRQHLLSTPPSSPCSGPHRSAIPRPGPRKSAGERRLRDRAAHRARLAGNTDVRSRAPARARGDALGVSNVPQWRRLRALSQRDRPVSDGKETARAMSKRTKAKRSATAPFPLAANFQFMGDRHMKAVPPTSIPIWRHYSHSGVRLPADLHAILADASALSKRKSLPRHTLRADLHSSRCDLCPPPGRRSSPS